MPGHQNWFQTSLENRPQNFEIKFYPYNFTDQGFHSNSVETLKLLSRNFENLYLGLSGGLDSEFILKTALENNLKITPIIVVSPFNTIEKDYALYFCRQHSIKFEIFNLDEKTFIESMIKKIYDLNFYNYFNALNLCLADFVRNKGGVLVTGFGDPFEVLPYPAKISNSITFAEWDFYLNYYDSYHPNCYFTYTPELLYSFIKEIDYSLPLQEAKAKLYKINFRPKIDYPDHIVKNIFTKIPAKNSYDRYFRVDKNILLNYFSQFKQI